MTLYHYICILPSLYLLLTSGMHSMIFSLQWHRLHLCNQLFLLCSKKSTNEGHTNTRFYDLKHQSYHSNSTSMLHTLLNNTYTDRQTHTHTHTHSLHVGQSAACGQCSVYISKKQFSTRKRCKMPMNYLLSDSIKGGWVPVWFIVFVHYHCSHTFIEVLTSLVVY